MLGRPKIDEVEVRFIIDPNTIIANVLAGTVELTLGRGLSFEQAAQAQGQWRDGKMDLSMDATSWIALFPQFVNLSSPGAGRRERPPSAAPCHRSAGARRHVHGWNDARGAQLRESAQPSTKPSKAASSATTTIQRRAMQLIEGLGYAKGADGIYRDAASERLNVEIRTTASDDLRDKILLTLANEWLGSGVAVEPGTHPTAARRRSRVSREPPSHGDGAPAERPVRGCAPAAHELEAALPENNYRGQNRVRYMNPEYDMLVDRYLATIPMNDRMEVVQQIVRHISENVPILGLMYEARPTLLSNRW